jgi:hypothetical protein
LRLHSGSIVGLVKYVNTCVLTGHFINSEEYSRFNVQLFANSRLLRLDACLPGGAYIARRELLRWSRELQHRLYGEREMKRRTSWNTWLLSFACMSLCGTVSAAAADDEATIRQVQAMQADAWNRHDAAAYAALFTEKTPRGMPEPMESRFKCCRRNQGIG